jgi:peptidoglycan/xylan/chitin deacetylase (PgdA/CDA1 family)
VRSPTRATRSPSTATSTATCCGARRAHATVTDATGVEPRWFRPPFGISSYSSLRAARGLGMTTVLWTTWGRDWRREATPASVVADVTRRYVDGGTVLLHDSDCTSYPRSWQSALGALPRLADEFAARGLEVGTVGAHGVGVRAA